MCGAVAVALLIAVVLANVVEVIAADNAGALHLGGHNNALQNATSNARNRCQLQPFAAVPIITYDTLPVKGHFLST